jgi:hypothetical protein
MIEADPMNREVLFPYMIGRDLIEHGGPTRWIIDFAQRDLFTAMRYELPFARVKKQVMPVVMERAEREKAAKGEEVTRYTRIAQRWWQFYDYRPGTVAAINSVHRYVACSRTTKRSIFEFVSSTIHADSKLVVFPLPDDYSFGVLQSGLHWEWIKAKGGTQTARFTYTSDTVFDTFPLAAGAHTRPGQSGRRSRPFSAGLAPRDHSCQRLVPARPLSHPRNPWHQPPPRRPSRPGLRRPRRLRYERRRRHRCLPVGTEPGTCGQGNERGTNYAAGSACPGWRSSRVSERRLRNSART